MYLCLCVSAYLCRCLCLCVCACVYVSVCLCCCFPLTIYDELGISSSCLQARLLWQPWFKPKHGSLEFVCIVVVIRWMAYDGSVGGWVVRKCEIVIVAKVPKAIKQYRITAKVRNSYFEKPPKARTRHRISAKMRFCYLCHRNHYCCLAIGIIIIVDEFLPRAIGIIIIVY